MLGILSAVFIVIGYLLRGNAFFRNFDLVKDKNVFTLSVKAFLFFCL
jgi:hypothetical protein